jgi:hypothetical protein
MGQTPAAQAALPLSMFCDRLIGMRLLPKNSNWVKFERAQKLAKKPRGGRTTARLKMMLMRARAELAARRDVSMEYGFLFQDVLDRLEARERAKRKTKLRFTTTNPSAH